MYHVSDFNDFPCFVASFISLFILVGLARSLSVGESILSVEWV